jgi:Tol biopolymer transport system component
VKVIPVGVVAVVLAACGGDPQSLDPPALLDVTIVASGERRSKTFRLYEGRLTLVTRGLGRRTVVSRSGSDPDRQGIAWEEIYLREADGSEARLTTDRRADLAPQLLRDGRVAFVSCVFRAGGSPACTLHAVDLRTRTRETLLDDLGVVFHGELSPDERDFLFTRLDERSGAPTGVYVRDLRNGAEKRIVDGYGGTWSPDGRRIAFVSDRDENGRCLFHDCVGHAGELYVADADGTDERRVTENPEVDGAPEWSGDGEWVVIGRIPDEDADWDLYAVRADGECEVQLTDTARWETRAEWHGAGDGGLSC